MSHRPYFFETPDTSETRSIWSHPSTLNPVKFTPSVPKIKAIIYFTFLKGVWISTGIAHNVNPLQIQKSTLHKANVSDLNCTCMNESVFPASRVDVYSRTPNQKRHFTEFLYFMPCLDSEKCIKMSTNKTMFGLVVLETICGLTRAILFPSNLLFSVREESKSRISQASLKVPH